MPRAFPLPPQGFCREQTRLRSFPRHRRPSSACFWPWASTELRVDHPVVLQDYAWLPPICAGYNPYSVRTREKYETVYRFGILRRSETKLDLAVPACRPPRAGLEGERANAIASLALPARGDG